MTKQTTLEYIAKMQAAIEALPDDAIIITAEVGQRWSGPNKYTAGPSIHLQSGIDAAAYALGAKTDQLHANADAESLWRYIMTNDNVELFQITDFPSKGKMSAGGDES